MRRTFNEIGPSLDHVGAAVLGLLATVAPLFKLNRMKHRGHVFHALVGIGIDELVRQRDQVALVIVFEWERAAGEHVVEELVAI